MATQPGWANLGSVLAGGNQLPAELAEAQGQSLGANTQNAIAEAQARIAQNKARADLAATYQNDPTLKGPLGNTLAGTLNAGYDPTKPFNAAKTNQEIQGRAQVMDPNTPDPQVARTLLALGQPAGLVKPIGQYAATNELHPDQGVTPTPLGTALANATVAQKTAETNNQNASAGLHTKEADALAIGPKPPPGFQYALGDDGKPVLDDQGQPTLRPITGGSKDPNTAGPMSAVEARTMERVINSGNQAARMLTNISKMPSGTSAGLLGVGSSPGHSLLQTTVDNGRNALSSQETNQYTTVMTGLNQALATMETFGMMPRGSFTDSMNRLVLREGDTAMSKATKLADARQILDSAVETLQNNPRLPPAQKAYLAKIQAQAQAAIPYTVEDTLALGNAAPGTTLGDIVKARKAAAGAPAAAPGALPAGWSVTVQP